jgi:hypothetical protein
MVIVAREFAVSSLRVAAAAEGAIIPASILGKIKTVIQVVAVMALIAANDPHATWVDVLVGLMVFATVASGVDYFLNVRREIEAARANLRAQQDGALGGRDEPLEQLVARSPAHVERAVEGGAVGLQHREQEIQGADAIRRAQVRHANGAAADRLDRIGFAAALGGGGGWSGPRVGHERSLRHPQGLKRLSDASMYPQHSEPALGFVLTRVREAHRRAGETEHDCSILRQLDLAPAHLCHGSGIGAYP